MFTGIVVVGGKPWNYSRGFQGNCKRIKKPIKPRSRTCLKDAISLLTNKLGEREKLVELWRVC